MFETFQKLTLICTTQISMSSLSRTNFANRFLNSPFSCFLHIKEIALKAAYMISRKHTIVKTYLALTASSSPLVNLSTRANDATESPSLRRIMRTP